MSFISYAQNFEDVILWRALKHVTAGFYIDVGANDPSIDSVTRHFYEAGWRGINIEPLPSLHEKLEAARPRDINLRIGAGRAAGSFDFYDIPNSSLATSDPDVAQQHRNNGWTVIPMTVEVEPLSVVCERYAPTNIHFLKIDVEGTEKDVIEGMDFKRWRPWVLVIEATAPQSPLEVHHGWDALVLGNGYDYVYFDGLNRYYVAQERSELKAAFHAPPNVFDDFITSGQHEARALAAHHYEAAQETHRHLQQAEQRLKEADRRLDEASHAAARHEADRHALLVRLNNADQELATVYASSSWKVTRPLRVLTRLLRNPGQIKAHGKAGAKRAISLARKVALKTLRKAANQPTLRRTAVKTLARFPRLDRKVRDLAYKALRGAPPAAGFDARFASKDAPAEFGRLPKSAQQVFAALQRGTKE